MDPAAYHCEAKIKVWAPPASGKLLDQVRVHPGCAVPVDALSRLGRRLVPPAWFTLASALLQLHVARGHAIVPSSCG